MIENLTEDSVKTHLRNLEHYGYTLIDNFLSAEEVASYKKLVFSYYEELKDVRYKGVPARDGKDRMVYNLPNKNAAFLKPILANAIEQILKPKLNDQFYRLAPPEHPNYYPTYYNARSSGEKLDLHIDSYIPSQGNHTWVMQVVIALEDMDERNGGTVVVPGSHKSGTYTDRELKNVQQLKLKAGDVAIWDSRLWHGTTENITENTRWALIGTFSQWWVKPAMDYTRSLPEEIYAQLSPKEKSLLGFCAIPPKSEHEGINTKKGTEDLKAKRKDYYEL